MVTPRKYAFPPRFRVSVDTFCTKWRIQGSYWSSSSRSSNVNTWPRNSVVKPRYLLIDWWKHLSQSELCKGNWWLNFTSSFIEFTLPWQRTLNNGSDAKCIFPRCLYIDRDLDFRQPTRGCGAKWGRSLVMAKRACMRCPKPAKVERVLWSGMGRVWKKFHVELWLGASGWSSSNVYIADEMRINPGLTKCLCRQVIVHSPRLGGTGDFHQPKLSGACPTTAAPKQRSPRYGNLIFEQATSRVRL